MLQLWPFYYSEHGAHLWHWYTSGFVHLRRSREEIVADVRSRPGHVPGTSETAIAILDTLNKITLDDLQAALREAGFAITKLELISHTVHIPPELQDYALSQLGIAGVKLLAAPREP
jgi:hypothetical protein